MTNVINEYSQWMTLSIERWQGHIYVLQIQHAALFWMDSNLATLSEPCNIQTEQAYFSKSLTNPVNAKDLAFAEQLSIDIGG